MTSIFKSRSLVGGTTITAILTLFSRLLGFLRDILVARLLGTGMIADAFYVAFRIPNLLRSFVAEGAMTSAFVPTFTSELKKGQPEANQALKAIITLITLITLLLTLAGLIYASDISHLFAPGFKADPEKAQLCAELTRIMFPYIIFISIGSLLSGVLNTLRIFGTPAIGQISMNVIWICGAVIAGFFPGYIAQILAVSVLIGGLGQIWVQIPLTIKNGFSLGFTSKFWTGPSREMMRLMLPALVGASLYQINIFVNTMLASLLSPGSVSWLYYADRLVQLPVGVYTMALASVLLPTLSKASADNDSKEFAKNLSDGLRFTSFLIIGATGIIFVFAVPLVRLFFERGAFTSTSTQMTALAVKSYALSIWASSCLAIVSRAFIARKDTITPTLVGGFALVINVLVSLILMGPLVIGHGLLYETISNFQNFLFQIISSVIGRPLVNLELGHAGLALASGVSTSVALIILVVKLKLKVRTIQFSPFALSTLRALLAAMLAGVVMEYLKRAYWLGLPPSFDLLLGILGFSILFLMITKILGSAELSQSLEFLLRRTKKTNQ